MRFPGDGRPFRRGAPRLAALCALLVLVPGICSAAVAALGDHPGMAHAATTPTPEAGHAHHAPVPDTGHAHHTPRGPGADPSPAPGGDDCSVHSCCINVLKNAGRVESEATPVADALPCASSTGRPAADPRSPASAAGWCPPGSPGLAATSAPLRR